MDLICKHWLYAVSCTSAKIKFNFKKCLDERWTTNQGSRFKNTDYLVDLIGTKELTAFTVRDTLVAVRSCPSIVAAIEHMQRDCEVNGYSLIVLLAKYFCSVSVMEKLTCSVQSCCSIPQLDGSLQDRQLFMNPKKKGSITSCLRYIEVTFTTHVWDNYYLDCAIHSSRLFPHWSHMHSAHCCRQCVHRTLNSYCHNSYGHNARGSSAVSWHCRGHLDSRWDQWRKRKSLVFC